MPQAADDTMAWRRSTYCSDGACVEITEVGDDVLMRDAKNISQPFLRFDRTAWSQFVRGVENGEFQPL